MKVTISAADGGNPYVVCEDGYRGYLQRRSVKGTDHSLCWTRADAYSIANAIVDMAERLPEVKPCSAPDRARRKSSAVLAEIPHL